MHIYIVYIYISVSQSIPLRPRSLGGFERLLEVGNNVIDVFRSDGDPNPVFRRARVQTLLLA